MSRKQKKSIGICAVRVPFMSGGAEVLCTELKKQCIDRGYNADILEVPFSWWPPETILPNAAAWRMLDLKTPAGKPIDLMITTKFPAYTINHSNKVAWLFHQMREAYDPEAMKSEVFSASLEHQKIRERIIRLDKQSFEEHKAVFTISRNVSKRLKENCGIDSETIYPPPKLEGKYISGEFGDYVLSVGRLDSWKRIDLLIEALSMIDDKALKVKIVGTGLEEENLKKLIKEKNLSGRVEMLGRVTEEKLIELYSNALSVYFAPRDEDYGFITVEAFLCAKPVITAVDSGGPTEFVENGKNGFLVKPEAREIADAVTKLTADRKLPEKFGVNGREKVRHISWNTVFDKIIEPYL